MSLVTIQSLSFTYPGSSTQALSDINLSLAPGEYIAVVGANGSGKSTLIRCLNGLLVPPPGTVCVDGFDPAEPSGRVGARKAMSVVFQSPSDQIVASIVEEDVAFGLENLGVPYDEMHSRVDGALGAVDLLAERHRSPRFLSSGQQQRLAVAGALAMRPRVVAFDEATSMIDPNGRAAILGLMDNLVSSGITVIHVTHDMDEAARAQRIVVLSEGRLVFTGTPERLFASRDLDGYRLELPRSYDAALKLGLEPHAGEDAAGLGKRAARACGMDVLAMISRLEPAASPADGSPAGVTAFSVRDASMSYSAETAGGRPAVQRASIEIPAGTLVALVGKTGAGKSSLLQLLDALAIPDSGSVVSLGNTTSDRSADLRSLRMRAPLAVQRPESAIFEAYVGDEVAFGPRNQGIRGAGLVERVEAALDAVGLPFQTYRDVLTRTLSGGMKRRLALASILSLDPEALLLDEPTAALDPATRRDVLSLIQSYARQGRTVVMSTHSMDEAALADMVIVMREGAIAASGAPDTVFGDAWDESWGIGRPFSWTMAGAAKDELNMEAVR
ncbi:MAG TPA: energy-coupling factor transporter ATPase [bacterium]|nr:energy-coupling factor transporter ATPase [bacterium]